MPTPCENMGLPAAPVRPAVRPGSPRARQGFGARKGTCVLMSNNGRTVFTRLDRNPLWLFVANLRCGSVRRLDFCVGGSVCRSKSAGAAAFASRDRRSWHGSGGGRAWAGSVHETRYGAKRVQPTLDPARQSFCDGRQLSMIAASRGAPPRVSDPLPGPSCTSQLQVGVTLFSEGSAGWPHRTSGVAA